MKNYLFLGDTHGDLDFAARGAELAAEHDAEIIQVGDWGFIWTHKMRTSSQVKQLSIELERAGEKFAKPPVIMRFIDGNHDNHPVLLGGSTQLAHNVIYQPRGSVHEDEDGTRFLFVGGAPSIDKDMRTPWISWWPEETITEADMRLALRATNIDVLVTHDAPDYPPGFTPKGTPEFRQLSTQSMNDIRKLVRHHQPKLHIHGHWHHAYVSGVTRGLDCNWAKFNDSMYLWQRNF
jgi:Icc-related predicted phosphoesterase